MSGNDNKDLHSKNNPYKFIALLIFHLEISGKDDKEEQL